MPEPNDDKDATGVESPFAPEDEFFLEIESRFSELRGTPFVFSARDWALMKSWNDEKVPLSLVLEAMESCFEARAKAPRPRTISSLSYCRHAVRDLWNERRSLYVGGADETPEMDAAAQLAQLCQVLHECLKTIEPAMRGTVERATEQVGAIRSTESVPRIEARLLEIEEEMMNDLERALPEELRLELVSSIEGELDAHRFRDDETRARTRKANLRRALRKEISIPRLSLFG